jgi:hypothetical protein
MRVNPADGRLIRPSGQSFDGMSMVICFKWLSASIVNHGRSADLRVGCKFELLLRFWKPRRSGDRRAVLRARMAATSLAAGRLAG